MKQYTGLFYVETTNKLVVLCDFLENHRVKITNKINLGGLNNTQE